MAKQGINFCLPVRIGMKLDDVSQIEFLFKQGETELEFIYPSGVAKRREGQNIIDLHWTAEQTYMFKPSQVELDTRISVKDSDDQPETEIVTFTMHRTLFEKEHGAEHD